jgi:hypothetical protein
MLMPRGSCRQSPSSRRTGVIFPLELPRLREVRVPRRLVLPVFVLAAGTGTNTVPRRHEELRQVGGGVKQKRGNLLGTLSAAGTAPG